MARTIFAMGGGGFTAEPGNAALDDFILTLTPRREPRVLFLPTASGDPSAQIAGFQETFGNRACRPATLSLFRLEQQPVALRSLLLEQDIIYVGGGSMRNLLAIWREHGLDRILREAWDAGIVLAGLSAGAMCWFERGVTRSTGWPAPTSGLGFLAGSLSVHYDGDPTRAPVFHEAIAIGACPDGYGADDGVGLLFEDRTLVRIVSSRPGARAYRVRAENGCAVRTTVEPEYLVSASIGRGAQAPADIREFRAARYRAGGRR